MCGICGFITANQSKIKDWAQTLRCMTRVLTHRGPDGEGHYCTDTGNSIVGLGHRRLSIIDLSEKAIQPMENEDGSVVVVFNGEIYNYEELTRELKTKGHKFRSRSDTEVIVHLYEEMGYSCIERLDAFANAILRVLADGSYFTGDFVKRARWTLRELDVTWDALVDQVEGLCQSVGRSS